MNWTTVLLVFISCFSQQGDAEYNNKRQHISSFLSMHENDGPLLFPYKPKDEEDTEKK